MVLSPCVVVDVPTEAMRVRNLFLYARTVSGSTLEELVGRAEDVMALTMGLVKAGIIAWSVAMEIILGSVDGGTLVVVVVGVVAGRFVVAAPGGFKVGGVRLVS